MKRKDAIIKELVRNDLTLEKWEIFCPHKFKGKSREIIRHTKNGIETATIGKTMNGDEIGVLTVQDGKIFYGLLKLWEKEGRPVDGKVGFSLSQLAREIGCFDSGNILKAISHHLAVLRGIPISIFVVNEDEKHITKIRKEFSLLSSVNIIERIEKNSKQEHLAFSYVILNEVIVKSILAGEMKPLRWDILKILKAESAFLIYLKIDLILADKTNYELDLTSVSEICGLSKNNPVWKNKQIITKALKELLGKPLSHGRIIKAEIQPSQTPSGWKCVFMKGPQSIKIPANLTLDAAAAQQKEEDDMEYFNSLNSEIKTRIKNQAAQEASQAPGWEIAGEYGKQLLVEAKILEKVRIQKKKQKKDSIQKEESLPPVTNPPVPPAAP